MDANSGCPPKRGNLVFDASFESGNLGTSTRLNDLEYRITVRPDTANSRQRLWFYFSVRNAKRGQRCVFHVTGFSKTRSLYSDGMSPVVRAHPPSGGRAKGRSRSRVDSRRTSWQRIPARATWYYRVDSSWILSFVFEFDEPDDTYYFAYSFPYTYTDLQWWLWSLERLQLPHFRRELLTKSAQGRRIDLLTITNGIHDASDEWTVRGMQRSRRRSCRRRSVSASRITVSTSQDGATASAAGAGHVGVRHRRRERRSSAGNLRTDAETLKCRERMSRHPSKSTPARKRTVVFSARVHPGESPSQWVAHGIIEFLLSNDREAVLLRDHVVFKIIPMLNPDGVFLGNYRSNCLGLDLNRHWKNPTPWFTPSISAAKNYLLGLRDSPDGTLDMYIDLHAHSTAANSFLFSNARSNARVRPVEMPLAQPATKAGASTAATISPPVCETMHRRTNVVLVSSRAVPGLYCADPGKFFSRLLEARSPDFSSLQSKAEGPHPNKEGAARRAMGDELAGNGVQCYTLETSFYASQDSEGRLVAYTQERYAELGRNICRTLLDYYRLNSKRKGQGGWRRSATAQELGFARVRTKSWT